MQTMLKSSKPHWEFWSGFAVAGRVRGYGKVGATWYTRE